MFEAAFASVAVLLPEDLQSAAGLQGAAIAAPLLLKQPGTSDGSSSVVMHTAVQHGSGAVQLSSRPAASGARGQPAVHLAAVAAAGLGSKAATVAFAAIGVAAVVPNQLRQALTSCPAWSGEAVANVCQQPLQVDSYHCHPAAVDAATHFGAAFDLSVGTAPRVPVALGRYSAAGSASSTDRQQLAAFASAGRLLQDDSRVSSFGIAADGTSVLRLAHLQSRPLGAQPPAAVSAAQLSATAADRLASNCCTYQTAWHASQPLPAVGNPGSLGPALLLQSDSSKAAVSRLPTSLLAAALGSYAAALRMLHTLRPGKQQQLDFTAQAASTQYGAPMAAAFSQAGVAAAGAAAVSGLLKVAALEEPAWQLNLRFIDRAAAGSSSGLPATDAHGAAAASAVAFVPHMQLAAEQPVDSSSGESRASRPLGCHVISGGLGGLGELTAAHLAQQAQQDSRLLLLGRTGRFSSQASASASQQQLLHASGSVAMLQADAAAAADAAGIVEQLTFAGAPLASFIHAAGVLADKLLPRQRMADARTVFAPKLAALAAALPAMQLQPMQQLLLFSSISAALGNRGQASYAAANAALDGAAAALVAGGCRAASLQWGAWAGAGMAAQTPRLLALLSKQGKLTASLSCFGGGAAGPAVLLCSGCAAVAD